MDILKCDIKNLTLRDSQKVVESVANISESILDAHSLALIISSSGEATYTSNGSKLLSEINFSHPLTKIIVNAALNYTALCGDDCKYLIFILHEIFCMLSNQTTGSDDTYMRNKLINETISIKKILPCIFKSINTASSIHIIDSNSDLFSKHLYSIVLMFMSSKFSVHVSKTLSILLCTFIKNIRNESNSLKNTLEYVISHIDMFVCRVLSPVTESRVIEGLLFYRTDMRSLNLQNAKFVVIWDLTMKMETDCSWKIINESFASKLNAMHVFEKNFELFKSLGISLLFTSSIGDNYVKALCHKHNIFLVDHLEKEEVEYLMLCLQVNPLENLTESVESKNIGVLNLTKSLFCNNSHFLNLTTANPMNFLNAHHILLSAPCKIVWKEYFSECLNCFKLIYSWLNSDSSMQNHEGFDNALSGIFDKSNETDIRHCNLCSELKISDEDIVKISPLELKLQMEGGILLTPGGWEYLFIKCIQLIPDKFKISCCTILPALDLAFEKSLCKRIGISFSHVKNFKVEYGEYFKKKKLLDVELLEPVICKEIMINSILDLVLQLLKINSIVFQK